MKFIVNFMKGIAIGSGAIIPGVSSGVLCVIFGVYEKLLDSILSFFKNIKENFIFLFPIILGVAVGVILFGNILKYVFEEFHLQTSFVFIGLIIGSIPTLLKTVSKKGRFKLRYLLYSLLALLAGVLMVFLEKSIPTISLSDFHFFYLILAGIAMSVGVIIPGVSSTIILMLFGVYTVYLESVSTLYFPILIPLGIGLVLGSFACMKLTKFLLEKYYLPTFYTIIGFTLGSIFVLFPGFTFDLNGIISILCFILGFYICTLFEKKE